MKFLSTMLPRVCAVLISALFIACAGTHAFAQATTTTTNENIPFTDTRANTCNADLVTFQGTMHVSNTVTTDTSGGFHLRTHVNYQDVSGTGFPSGIAYRVGTSTNEMMNDSSSPQTEATVIQTVKLISQSSVPNLFLRIVFHITINANGQTTSTVTESSIECRG